MRNFFYGSIPAEAPKLFINRHSAHNDPRASGNRPVISFVTICSHDRKPILAGEEQLVAIEAAWRNADTWMVGRYVVMPDHVHFFASPATNEHPTLDIWIKYFKRRATIRWHGKLEGKVWQTDYWDRQLRSGERYEEKWQYVRHNPVRHGLVTVPEEWPYQGEMNILNW